MSVILARGERERDGLRGKLVSELSIKYSKGDAFHLFRYPNNIPLITPQRVQSVDLLSGQWGSVGSVIFYNITIAGKKKVAKEITEAIDKEKRWITCKMIEGDLMELYSAFRLGFNVETDGEDHLVTITLDYDELSEAVPDPHAVMDNIRGGYGALPFDPPQVGFFLIWGLDVRCL